MATPYEDIFSRFLKRIEDKDLPKYTEDERQEMMTNWLDMAIGYIELDGLKIKKCTCIFLKYMIIYLYFEITKC